MHSMSVLLPLSLPKKPLMNCPPILSQSRSLSSNSMSVPFWPKSLILNCLLVQVQSLKCLLVQFPSMSLFLNCLFYQLLSMNCLLQSLSMPPVLICLPDHNPQVCLIQNYLYVLFQSLSPTLNFLSVQPLSRRPIPSLLPCLSQPRNPSWNP